MIAKVTFSGFKNCLRLANNEVEIIVSTDFGPRILAYNLIGGENVFGIPAEDIEVTTTLGTWKAYGGHRLWLAPENMPDSYAPDNSPVKYSFEGKNNSLKLVQPIDVTQIRKSICLSLDNKGSEVKMEHQITNCGNHEIELSAWALTIMRSGGEVRIPNEAFAPYGNETLLPVRNMAVWSYTDLSDSRWHFEPEFIRFEVNPQKKAPQKIGVLNKTGSVKYVLEDVVFIKQAEYFANAPYPDLNSNIEVYSAGSFIEIETLSPLKNLKPGTSIIHTETWRLEENC